MRTFRLSVIFMLLVMAIGVLLWSGHAFAGNIDPDSDGSAYAYGENVGWINLNPTGGGVTVMDTSLTGSAWGENVGWIILNCFSTFTCLDVNYKVTNDGAGNLSGYAWGENIGWINFAPTGGGVTINPNTGVFSGKAWGENTGWISFSATSPVAFQVKTSWRGNQAPVANSQSVTTPEDTAKAVTLTGSDPDGDTLTYTVLTMPVNGTLTGTAPNLTYTPGTNFNGSDSFTFKANDGTVDSNIATVSITVTSVNDPPVLDPIGPRVVDEGIPVTITVSGSDPDGDTLIYSATGLPAGASFNAATRTFTWTPTYTQSGLYDVTFTVKDGVFGLSDSEIVTIKVNNANQSPVLDPIGPKSVDEGSLLSFTITGSDPDGGTLTYSVTGLPAGATFNTTTQIFDWTPGNTQAGKYSATFTVSDGSLSDSEVVAITVNDISQSGTSSQLVNISTRGMVQTGDSVMIGGFIISGTAPRSVLIRGFGPTLTDFGVTGSMANPYIELYSGQTMIATNDEWQMPITQCDAPAVSCGTPQDIQATGKDACTVATTGCSQDAAILVTLPPGAYTAIMRGVGGGTGVGLVAVDDNDTGTLSKLVNISTRGPVLTGDSVMIGGFIVSGSTSKTVLIRGFGPTLADFGVPGSLANPYIELYSGQTMIATNDNWQTPITQCDAPAVSCGTPQDIQATGKDACTVATTGCSQDAAILVTLPPGAYTAIMRGVNNGTGVGLVGIDEIGP